MILESVSEEKGIMISQNTDRHALHMSEVIRMAMKEGPSGAPGEYPERDHITDPDPAAKLRPLVWAGVGLLTAALIIGVVSKKRSS